MLGSGLLSIGSQLPALLGIDLDSALYAIDVVGVVRNLG